MDGERIIVLAVAAIALLAFGVSAANVDGVVDDERQNPNVDDAADREVGEPPGPPQGAGACLIGCGGARSLLAGLLDGLSTRTVLIAGAVAGLALTGLYVFARGGAGEEPGATGATPTVDAPAEIDHGVAVSAPPDVDATNEVYRAWRELAADLDPGGEGTLTPAEYAARARRRGYDEAAVETLTEVFRQVRYGRGEATADRETRARRAIDDALGEDGT